MTSQPTPPVRIAIFGNSRSQSNERHGCGLWAAGPHSVIQAAGGDPVLLDLPGDDPSWDQVLDGIDGVLINGDEASLPRSAAESLCRFCKKQGLPLLAIDQGMHLLNGTFNGTLFTDLPREQPEALQHRHPPEKGLRHAICVTTGSRLGDLYGEGEVIVNSEHRRAVQRVGRGLIVTARALDGIVEGIEAEETAWFCVGVQWQPASSTASGLDIQVFRGLIDAARARAEALMARAA